MIEDEEGEEAELKVILTFGLLTIARSLNQPLSLKTPGH